MTEREPSLEALRREFEYRIRTAVTYGLGRGEHGDSADRDVAGWIDREIGAAMASLTVSQVIEAVRQEERERIAAEIEPVGEPGNPFSYDPWDDGSVDTTNLSDVVHAAVSEGWSAGAWHKAAEIAKRIREQGKEQDRG